MSSHSPGERAADRLADADVVEIGSRVLADGPVADLPPMEVTRGQRFDVREEPDHGRAMPGRGGMVLAIAFAVGLTIGIGAPQTSDSAASGADEIVDMELETVLRVAPPVPTGSSSAVIPVTVPVRNAGRDDVTVLGISLPGWNHGESGGPREAIEVPSGESRTVRTGVPLDCSRASPATPTTAELRLRTESLGVISMSSPLSRPARSLPTSWDRFCAGHPTAVSQVAGRTD